MTQIALYHLLLVGRVERAEVVWGAVPSYLHVTSRIVGVFVGTTPSKSPGILSPIHHAQKIAVAAGPNFTHSASRA